LISTAGCILRELGLENSELCDYIEKIVSIYMRIILRFEKIGKRDIFGLRDFYSTIKYISSEWTEKE
jgi:hypothetical protein